MTSCEQVRELLPLALTGDLVAADAASLASHLARCPECCREQKALNAARQALDAVSSPAVNVDVADIYRAAADRQKQALRRWRRVAVTGMAIAACLLLFVLFRLDFEVGNGQLVVSWGPRPQSIPIPQPALDMEAIARATAATAELEERV